jgi:glycosyltransferase involved in cell wall biosynthesis/SAM-dependent methyltransferase
MNDAHSRYPVEEHRRFAADTRCGAVVVTNILERWLDLRTVLDLGCGTGTWLRVLQSGGRRQVFGVDIEVVDPADLEVDPDLILTADVGRKLDLHQRYDLVVCLEVAEHIDAQFADTVVDNCVRHADLVLFSAALPGQQGFNHVNEQPPRYWAERFQRHGYIVLDLIRPLIWDDPQIPVWYRQNMLLFAKDGSSQLDALHAKAEAAASFPLAVAHPDYMRWFSTQTQIATAEADAARQRLIQAQTEFELSLARHRESDAQARSALEAALADAARQRAAENTARVAAEAAAADVRLRYEAEGQARAAAEAALADAVRRLAAETASRVDTEGALAEATREWRAASEARTAAEAALADAVRRHAAETASRVDAEAACAEATREWRAASEARTAAEAALTTATREWQAESEARGAAEAALAKATREWQAESEARTAAEAALAMATREWQAESEARTAAEAALANATREWQAASGACTAAEAALADAVRRHAAETTARVGAEAAFAEATREWQAESEARTAAESALVKATREWQAASEARAAAEGAFAHAAYRCNVETTARVAAEAGLADAARRLQAAAAERAATGKILDEMRWSQERAATALAAATRRLLAEAKARTDAAAALADAERRHAEEVRARIADSTALAQARRDLVAAQIARDTAQRAHDLATAELATARGEIATLCWERGIILGSTLWGATEPLRRLGRAIAPSRRQQLRRLARALVPKLRRASHPEDERLHQRPPEMPPMPEPTHVDTAAKPPSIPPPAVVVTASPVFRIVFISGEPAIPGHVYRVQRYMDAARALDAEVVWLPLCDVAARGEAMARANVIIIWRAPNGPEVAHVLWVARDHGVKVLLDVDDLMFDPKLASTQIIDGIRTQDLSAADVADHFQRMKEVVVQVDACTCTTEELARHLRALDRVTFVLPNLFDAATHCISRLAVRQRLQLGEGTVRIGYAAGTRTHQRDFRNAALALERLLVERPQCRLVVFRDPDSGRKLLDVAEFPALARLAERIEWRDRVPLEELPNELARFDINLAPLEVGNPFCEAKSELKFFEAALVEVCTIASPTGPLRRAIRDRETGRLADTQEEWYDALRELIDDPAQRRRMAHAAYLDVLARFGPQTGVAALRSVLEQLSGDEAAARAFQLGLLRERTAVPPQFDIPTSSVAFQSDQLGDADVTVIVPLYNYAQFIEDALESVRNQTLAQIDLVVVDDASGDESLQIAVAWARRHAARFNRLLVLTNAANSGLARSRNVGFNAAETPFVLPLDADNRLRTDCCASLLAALRDSRAAFAYSRLQCFGDADHVIGIEPFSAIRLASSNYIDAMAMVAKWCWATVGGYTHIQYGWEDYDFWCKCVEHGLWGQHIPEVLAEYRVHAASMLRTSTDQLCNKRLVIRQLEDRHGWMSIDFRP